MNNLTEKELKIMYFAAKGMNNKQIAGVLDLPENQIRMIFDLIYRRFSVSNRLQALIKLAKLGLI